MNLQGRNLTLNTSGSDVKDLHTELARLGLNPPAQEVSQSTYGPGTQQIVSNFQASNSLPVTGQVDAATASALTKAPGAQLTPTGTINSTTAAAAHSDTPATAPASTSSTAASEARSAPATQYIVSGQIIFDYGSPAHGVIVRAYNRGFAGADTKLGETKTNDHGMYSLTYSVNTGVFINLDIRTVDNQGNEIVLSSAALSPSIKQVMNLVAPSANISPLLPEYQRLSTQMTTTIGGIAKLSAAQENDTRQDLSLLSNTTGWDARLLALASNAAVLGQSTGLDQETLYGLLRAGLPADAGQLSLMDPAVVQQALTDASTAGVIGLSAKDISTSMVSFNKFASQTRLTLRAPGANSTFGDFLGKTSLTADQQTAFADLYFNPATSDNGFWESAAALGIPADGLNMLKLQGKLSSLTVNNADLTAKLQQDLGSIDNLSQLVDKDLHKDIAWITYITGLAGKDPQALDKLIPPLYVGDTPADRLAVYAADLARKVRISFPTQVATRMVEQGDLTVIPNKGTQMVTALKNASALGFQLGRTSLNVFLGKNQSQMFNGVPTADVATVTSGVATLHRLYQITPSSDSLKATLNLGFTSAQDIAAFSPADFIKHYGRSFPSIQEANLVHRKAQQVSAVTLNVLTLAKQLNAGSAVKALSPSDNVTQAAQAAIVEKFPTMQSLFGSMDFCECDDCRSVLSPAAYLVEILRFLDPSSVQWQAFLSAWANEHSGKNYTDSFLKPYDALVARRPDLPNLPLTCENTNTVMPYIDVVNEILEYYIAKGSLDAAAAYDTGEALSADLIAEPQNLLPTAYATLLAARYPMNLPFDLWLEMVRKFLAYFQLSLTSLLESFRSSDQLELFTDSNKYPYYRSDILFESFGISPAEHALFSDPLSLTNWFQLYGYSDEPTALKELTSAETLSQTLGISYQDLVDLISTGFINPKLSKLVVLQNINIPLDNLFSYLGYAGYPPLTPLARAAFENYLTQLTQKYAAYIAATGFDIHKALNSLFQPGDPSSIILLFSSTSSNDFASSLLQNADGTAVGPLTFLKLNLFVRLWKKTTWTMAEMDSALQVFLAPILPDTSDANFGADFQAAMNSTLIYLAHLQSLMQKLTPNSIGLISLLPCWSNIFTTGSNSLYSQLFLTASAQADPIFDDPMGNYLSATTVIISDHVLTLQGALGLSADDISAILTDASLTITAPLSLANVSILYRYSVLAKGLGLSISDLISLKTLSGLQPFAPLNAQPLKSLTDDVISQQMLLFIEYVLTVRASNFSVEDLKYLYLHQFDPVGKYHFDADAFMQLVRSLAASVRLIQSGNAVPADPLAFTDDVIKQKLGLLFPTDVVQTVLAMWNGTIRYTVSQTGVPEANQLDADTLANFPIQVSYDSLNNAQQLTYQGVLLDPQKAQIEAANTSPVLASLLDAVQGEATSFFQKYFQYSGGSIVNGFLPAPDFNLLFAPTTPGTSDLPKRVELAGKLLPYLQHKLITEAVVEAIVGDTGADQSLLELLLTDDGILCDPTQANTTLCDAFSAIGQNGLTVSYFASPDASGPAVSTGVVTTLSTADASLPKPAAAKSARFEGYLEVQAEGTYYFFAELPSHDAQVTCNFDVAPAPFILATSGTNGSEFKNSISLKAGIPYHFDFTIVNLTGGDTSLLVLGEGIPKGPLNQLTLYPQQAVDRFERSRLLLGKALDIIHGFGLTEREVTYLTDNSADFDNLNFSILPTDTIGALADASASFAAFLRLADYATLKQGPAGGTDGLIDIFLQSRCTFAGTADVNASSQTVLQQLYQTIATLTRRDATVVQAGCQQLGFTAQNKIAGGQLAITVPALTQEEGFGRLWNVMQIAQATGVSIAALAKVTAIIDSSQTADARASIATGLKNAIKALYPLDLWRPIAQSIFDPLRQAKRDALCAYLVTHLALDNTEQLFEYFLVDPGMEPVVTTSRIRLALSSVQTFIQRCQLNLEAKVSPSVINSDQWEWMKRYRVWQANREIFLWPENWMEPEWRLDKTDLFQDLESALLQGDVTNDLVEDALLAYLKGLDARARLDIVTMYMEQGEDPSSNKLHVVGRNHCTPQKYFYRTYQFGVWSAWEPVKPDIDGDHIAAIIWRDRLHLFWVTFAPTGQAPAQQSNGNGTAVAQMSMNQLVTSTGPLSTQKQMQLQLHWTDYFQGKWGDRMSSDLKRSIPIDVDADFDPLSVYIHVSIETPQADDPNAVVDQSGVPMEGAVKIILDGTIQQAFRLVGKNSEPELTGDYEMPEVYAYGYLPDGNPQVSYNNWQVNATKLEGSGALYVMYPTQIQWNDDSFISAQSASSPILNQGNDFSLLVSDAPVMNISRVDRQSPGTIVDQFTKMLKMPFFYQDIGNDITFFVQPTVSETTVVDWIWWLVPPSRGATANYKNRAADSTLVSQVAKRATFVANHASAVYNVQPRQDWLTDPVTTVQFGQAAVGHSGIVSASKLNLSSARIGTAASSNVVKSSLNQNITAQMESRS